MTYLTLIILLIFGAILFFIINENIKSKIEFRLKSLNLEQTIIELSQNLKYQTYKIKLSNDLIINISKVTNELSTKISKINSNIKEVKCLQI